MPLHKGPMEKGKELVGQGRMLARASRGEGMAALDPNRSRLAAGRESARRLMGGTQMQNKAQQQQQMAQQIQPQGGLAQMMKAKGADKSMVKAVQQIEDTPGGKELLYTKAAEELMQFQGMPKKDTKKVRLYKYGGSVERAYAEGGKVKAAAERTRSAGRGEDEMLVHMTEEEFGVLKNMWGDPDINPNTGMPEYGFLSKIWKKVKKVVKKVVSSKIFQVIAPIALSIFAPGLGTAIGGMLTGGGTGLVASTVGNAVLQGGLSAAGGGDFVKGALSGAITGGLGKVAGGKLANVLPGVSEGTRAIIGSSLAGGAASAVTGGDFVQGALAGATGEMMRPMMEKVTAGGQKAFGLQDPEAGGILAVRTPEDAAIAEAGGLGEVALASQPALGVEGMPAGQPVGGGDKQQQQITTPEATAAAVQDPSLIEKYAMPALLAASALGGGEQEQPEQPPLPEGWNDPLPLYEMDRQFAGMDPSAYYTYGQAGSPQSGQHLFMEPQPFAGVPQDPTTPTPGAGGDMQSMIAAGQPVPASAVGIQGTQALTQAGYTQDPGTGNWNPPQLGQGLPQARGGYQRGGEYDYWSQNADVPRAAPTVASNGRYVKGQGTGRSDDIPARLSDGEYVMDAETVALLGDGSGSAGARRLDEMRRNLRQHKAKNLRKGGFSHKAKQPHQYMAQGGMVRLRRAMIESGRI